MIPYKAQLNVIIIGCILFCLFSTSLWSQQNGFNYKAIIKDDLGNVVSNQSVTIQFTILEDATQVYQETHTPTTNANGLVILTIGLGTTSDAFSDINWGELNHRLNTKVDMGNGLVDLGTTLFQSVPYASYAINSSGLQLLTEDGNTGWRFNTDNQRSLGSIGNNAVDLSGTPLLALLNFGATGDYSTAMGEATTADSYASVALGRYNIGGGTADSWQETDPLLEIGNGDSSFNRSNALTILKNGTVTAPSFDINEITDDKALITKEYADINLGGSGLEAITENSNQGWRLVGADPIDRLNIGIKALDFSRRNNAANGLTGASGNFAIALGLNSVASGYASFASGQSAIASGGNSSAFGRSTASGSGSLAGGESSTASGSNSVALGNSNNATGLNSVALGTNAAASGENTIALGFGTIAESLNSIAIGRFNIGGGSPDSWSPTDPLFEVGNALSVAGRSNALTILKNGTITAPSFDLAEITNNKALITKEFFDSNSFSGEYSDLTNTPNIINPTGLEAIDEGNGIGWRLKGQDPTLFDNIGEGAVDLSNVIVSTSGVFGASGFYAYAVGTNNKASGDYSTAIGSQNEASGLYSLASGSSTKAIGGNSVAMGAGSQAIGNFSLAGGFITKAESLFGTALGSYNIGGGDPIDWDDADPLFEVGNGEDDANRSNALTILKNGKVGIIEHQPNSYLHIKADSGASVAHIELTETNASDGARLSFNNNEETANKWTFYGRARDNSMDSRFNLFHSSTGNILVATGDGKVGVNRTPATNALEVNGSASKTTAGSWLANSDKRLKRNIKTLSPKDALQLITKLRGVTYNWNDTKTGMERPKGLQYGFIAQEIKDIFPEKVSKDNLGYYQTAYGDYDALFVQSIKGLNGKIKDLEKENALLKAKLNKLEELEARLTALENSN